MSTSRSCCLLTLLTVMFVLACAPADEAGPAAAEPTDASDPPAEDPMPADPVPGTDTPDDVTPDPDPQPEPEPDPVVPDYPTVYGVAPAVDENPAPGIVEVSLTASMAALQLLPDTPKTILWTYNGQLPGPLIQARVGDRVIVHLENDLPEPTTIHWHGMRVPNEMDGTPRTQDPVQPGETFTYDFIVEDAGTYWYHPHTITHVQVERGLYGVLVVHEAEPPDYDAERIVFMDDIYLTETGSVAPFVMSHPVQMHGRFGNVLLHNGQVVAGDEYIELQRGTIERWRVLNSANARTALLRVQGAEADVIGWDGGLIPESYPADVLRVAPGERYDLEVRFDPGPGGSAALEMLVPQVVGQEVQLVPLTVTSLLATGHAPLPARTVELPEITLPEVSPAAEPTMVLELDGANVGGTIQWWINGKTFEKSAPVDVPIGTVHTIDIVNKAAQEHPFHIHGHFFRVISRNGVAEPYDGWKDTVYVGANETVRLVLDFDNPGGWMAHCHILEHAALGMMSLIEVK